MTCRAGVALAADSDGTGTVVFFRGKELLGAAVGYHIYDGTTEVGKLKYGTYFAVRLPAGSHQFVVNSWRKVPFPLEIEAGKTYYLMAGVTTQAPHPVMWTTTEAVFQDMRGYLKDVGVTAVLPPPPSQPPVAQAATVQVFGRLKVVAEDGRVYYPIVGASKPSDPTLVERFEPSMSLLRLESSPRDTWTDLEFKRNGLVIGSVAPGDYVLASISPRRAGHARVEAVALLRVPDVATSVFAGDLTITIALENTAYFIEPQPYYVVRGAVTDDPGPARQMLEAKSGPLEAPPTVSLWCLDLDPDRDLRILNHSVAVATLSMGCKRPDQATVDAP